MTAPEERGIREMENYQYQRSEGVGPERVAELRAMYENGTLGDYCNMIAEVWALEMAQRLCG